jgi:hypothetical protein
MRHNLFILTLLIFGCSTSNEKTINKDNVKNYKNLIQQDSLAHKYDTLQLSKTVNPIYEFINEKGPNLKTGLPTEIPKYFLEDNKYFPKTETKVLKLDTNSLRKNYQYLLSEQRFLNNSSLETNQTVIYFYKFYTYMLSKRLRVFEKDTTYDLILAEDQGDGQNGSKTFSKFYENGTFIETTVLEETVKDFTHVMAYNYDTITRTFTYDKQLNFELIKRDSVHSYVEHPRYYKHLNDSVFSIRGSSFIVNNHRCNWVYEVKYSDGIDENSREILVDLIGQKLTTYIKGEKVLLNLDLSKFVYIPLLNIANLEYTEKDNFPADINHDGKADFVFQTESAAGGANITRTVYSFNENKISYDYDTLFSGTNIEYDTLKNRISSFWKLSVVEYTLHYLNLDSTKRKVLFTESIAVSEDSLTYTKRINEKIVKTKMVKNDSDFEKLLERKK